MNLKVLVTGANGQLGYDICKQLTLQGIDHYPLTSADADITDELSIKSVISIYDPKVVIHCAAFTDVDKAEVERDLAYSVNTLGTRYIAEACRDIEAKLVYMSTDYVLNDKGESVLDENSIANPINWYGYTKYQGELEVQNILTDFFILRISWVFGLNGNNFVKTMLKLGSQLENIKVVSDQVGSPTNTVNLSELIMEMIHSNKYGIYNATNDGFCSWAEFAEYIFKISNIECTVNRVSSEEYKTVAVRPKNSRLSKEKLEDAGFQKLGTWEDATKQFLELYSDSTK